jgi:predicted O-methyltransferase YrrM
MYQLLQYFKFLGSSTNQHGVHSPFVYDLVTNCLYDTTTHEAYAKLKAYRKSLCSNKTLLHISDFGAGSKVFKSNQRPVNRIAKTSGTSLKRAQLLLRIVQYLQPTQILELGTSLGIATQALALGTPKATITSIEGCPATAAFAKQHLSSFAINNTNLKQGRFEEHIPKLAQQPWDLVFIDGNHQGEATLKYFEALLASVHNDTIFIMDDIYWSKTMTDAWETIKQHPKVTVTIDTFFWGLVGFRKEQAKENFKIRL